MLFSGRGVELNENKILIGILGEEKTYVDGNGDKHGHGVYYFSGYGPEGTVFPKLDAIILTPDAAVDGTGFHGKPVEGSHCVAVLGPGGTCYVIGFHLPIKYDKNLKKKITIGDASDEFGKLNNSPGDKVWFTEGGARLRILRGGSVLIGGGPGVGTSWLKEGNVMTSVAQTITEGADGFKRSIGKIKSGSEPETMGVEQYFDKTGPSSTRTQLKYGHLANDGRRELTVSVLATTGPKVAGTIKFRETHYDDGSWVGEGSKFQFGKDADENALLGKVVVDMLKKLIGIIKDLKVNTAWGPSGPPVALAIKDLTELQSNFIDNSKILSDYIFLSKKAGEPVPVNE